MSAFHPKETFELRPPSALTDVEVSSEITIERASVFTFFSLLLVVSGMAAFE
jgi:hypothetical protein